MNKEFIPYEQALALKKLGFDEPCFGHYLMKKFYLKKYHKQGDGITLRPTYSQAFRFFREKYKLQPSVNSFCFEEYSFTIMDSRNKILYPIHHKLLNDGKKNPWEYETYEEAELACLIKLIEIVKNE